MPVSQAAPVLQEFPSTSEVEAIRVQLNALIAAFYAVLQKLDADAGVTDANYTALHGADAAQVTVHV